MEKAFKYLDNCLLYETIINKELYKILLKGRNNLNVNTWK